MAVNVGLGANIILALMKTFIGITGHSPALLADGINSTSDVAYGIVVNVFMRLSGKPADREHPYGHEQLESIAAVVVGAFVMTTAIAIFWNSINSTYLILSGMEVSEGASLVALWVAVFTVALKLALAFWTDIIGKQTRNTAVTALASDHRNDVFASIAATVGIYFGRMELSWIDPLAGALVSLIILHTGIDIIRSSAGELMDTLPDKTLTGEIKSIIAGISEVAEVEEIKIHRFGPNIIANITIGVDGTHTITRAHRIATRLERTLIKEIESMRKVYVHYHPVRIKNQFPNGDAPENNLHKSTYPNRKKA